MSPTCREQTMTNAAHRSCAIGQRANLEGPELLVGTSGKPGRERGFAVLQPFECLGVFE